MSVCLGTDGFMERTEKVLMARIFVGMKQKMSLVTLPRAETQQCMAHTCFSLLYVFYFYLDLFLSPFPLSAPAVPHHPTTLSPFPSPTWPLELYPPALILQMLSHCILLHPSAIRLSRWSTAPCSSPAQQNPGQPIVDPRPFPQSSIAPCPFARIKGGKGKKSVLLHDALMSPGR